MKILVLFDGAGLARLGLEQAGHDCLGVDLDPIRHHLGKLTGSGNVILSDATKFKDDGYNAIWASPPCAKRSTLPKDLTGNNGYQNLELQHDYLEYCLKLKSDVLWVENVTVQKMGGNDWGKLWNAAQFLAKPIQCRNRVIGDRYPNPKVFRDYRRAYDNICPCVGATEYKGCASDRMQASRFYGRKLTLEECAMHQGFKIPILWYQVPDWYMSGKQTRYIQWQRRLYEAVGDGVPVYMAKAFGKAL